MKKVFIVLLIIILIIIGFIIKVNILDKNNNILENKIIHYYYKDFYYDIKINNNDIDVTRFVEVKCSEKPCDLIRDDQYSIKYNNSFNKLDSLFNNDKEITIKSDEVDKDIYNILLEVIKEKELDKDSRYSIIDNLSSSDNKYKDTGYYVDDNGSNKIITIALGERNTGGYGIQIKDVVIENNNILIYVRESTPKVGESVTMAFTYPITRIELHFKPNKIEVQDIDTFREYKRIN